MKKIILNQKSYLLYDEIVEFKKNFEKIKTKDYEFILFPSVLYLTLFKDVNYKVGTQNFYSYKTGSFSGEINLESLKNIGINYTLVGHFERKKILNESYEDTKEKLFKSLNSKCNTILCVGEENKRSKPFNYIKKQINYYLKSIESQNLKYLSIAYIPTWAVGVANNKISKIEKTINDIKKLLNNKYKIDCEVYYGGYIDNENIKEIYDICDGVVLDKESINIDELKSLISKL